MIDFDQHRVISPLSSSSSDLLINDSKFPSSSHLYFRQQHTVQIIQLVECPPPSPRRIGSVINGSAASSSQYSSEDSDSSADEDEGSVGSSYCSSDLPLDQPQSTPCDDESTILTPGPSSQSYSLPLKRILAWREDFSTPLSTTLPGHSLSSCLKRKIRSEGDDDREDDSVSHSSKRSRPYSRSQFSLGGASTVSVDMHSCPACDLSFPTPQSLRQHGRDAEATNEACSVAVEYAFE